MTTIPKLALLLPLLAASPALAQGTEAQRAACGPDAFRLCASSIPDPGRTAACLRRERERLSSDCRAMFDAADAKTRTAAAPAPKPAAAPVRTARAEGERRSTAPRLPRQEAAATPRAEPRRAARVARLDRPARATPREAAGADAFGGFSGLEAQALGWHRTLAGYADSIERRFARLGSVDAGRLDLGRLPGL
ncbi:hypothetical protein [Methylorubrum sp. SB2]|uniref:hypothetical protein n=1 Tax=Methylorubrum subtropicum TaxID=3138812 RepID=UPI00313EC450